MIATWKDHDRLIKQMTKITVRMFLCKGIALLTSHDIKIATHLDILLCPIPAHFEHLSSGNLGKKKSVKHCQDY